MSYTNTPNLGLYQIDYNTEENTWGNLLNDNASLVDDFSSSVISKKIMRHVTASGVDGGDATAGAWTDLPFNEDTTTTSWSSRNGNNIILEAGQYYVRMSHFFYATVRTAIALYVIPTASFIVMASGFAKASTQSSNFLSGETFLSLGATSELQLVYNCGATSATFGLGLDSQSGQENCFGSLTFQKVS